MSLILRTFARSLILAALVAAAAPAQAAWPERPVTLVVPFTAGGITDLLARALAERLQAALKQPFLVEDLPGGAGVVAADHVLRAPADGYTLLFTPIFQIDMAPFTHKVKFDPVRDFKPIAAVAAEPVRHHGGRQRAGERPRVFHRLREGTAWQAELRVGGQRQPHAGLLGDLSQERRARHGPDALQGRRAGPSSTCSAARLR